MKEITGAFLTGERALFNEKDLKIYDTIFDDGESPLKESSNLELTQCSFRWKYPLWYCNKVRVNDCTWFDKARAGVWYTNDIEIKNSIISAPKNFRRCDGLTLDNVKIPKADETLWSCQNVTLKDVFVRGDYFAMNTHDIKVDNLELDGNYSFDGSYNVEIRNSKLISKDAFWNSDNVTVYDSYVYGEYLGWNAKNLTLVNCTIESLQGMCYIDNIVIKNCRLINTTLSFEYSTNIDAEIINKVDSVFNPAGGKIKAAVIGDLTIQKDKIDPSKTIIECENIEKVSDEPTF